MSASNPGPLQSHLPQRSNSSFSALRHRDFRLLWMGQIVSVTGSQMQLVAINWHVYLLTKSPLALGMVGLFRGAPIILCSLLGGVVADAVDRKRLMIATQTVMLLSAAALTLVTLAGLRSVWPIYLLTGIASGATAFDIPARQALMPTLVPAKDFPNAVSLGLIVFNVAMIAGPAVAGLLLASHGPAVVYGTNAVSFLAVIAALTAMHTSGRPSDKSEPANRVSYAALKEGLAFVWRTPIIVQTMTLDFAATFFASATALLPIFAEEILHVGARGLGLLAAAPAVGSVTTALIIARIGGPRKQGGLVIGSIAIFGLATVAFGVSRAFWFSLTMLGITGAADTVSTVLRQTIRQLATPNQLRGRMTSINMVFFMGGPQLGEVEAGFVAALIGAPLSVVVGGVGSLLAAAIAAVKGKSLLNYESEQQP
ncbi:MAG TPA: MFS transporter [Blastocatellia bacterium]|nr:MFS transporter [Blastocatellia bacterium]HAF25468.1 MFS transporter [Blastocatellia bacterium]